MNSSPSLAERRAFGCRPTYQFAVVHRSGRTPLRCAVRDVSEGSSLEADCEMRHAQGSSAGVQFVGDVGARIVRESLKLGPAVDLPPLAPEPERDTDDAGAAASIVHRFREQRIVDITAAVALIVASAKTTVPSRF